ncbi:hypothetical protein [Homoserinibacter gongjuensis]|uniref:Ig-like domain-containing protein n=1 Tax=Homoserinibacter gongjuensis TaxID=1162968 RepID=A0ABQ6JSF4_9MICO|nr:hypothetical protein [Homoserinibacter gongjuensis]GMA91245.1 hypothetical protein GCM10025869_17740 [Homoserinibacter gongjuensis]
MTSTTPVRRLAAGATTALLALGLLTPAALAVADELPVEDQTTTVLDEATAPVPDEIPDAAAAPASDPEPIEEGAPASESSAPESSAPETPSAEAPAYDASASGAPASGAPTAQAFAAVTDAPAQFFTPTIAAGATWTGTVEVTDMVFMNLGALGAELSGRLRSPAGTSYAFVSRPEGSAAVAFSTSTPQSGTVTLSVRNEGSTERVVPIGFSYRTSTVDNGAFSSIGKTFIELNVTPQKDGVLRPDATARARIVGLDAEYTAEMTPIVPSSPQRRARFDGVVPGPYLAFATVTLDGEEHSVLVVTHAAATDTTPPVVEYLTNPASSNARGWFRQAVTVTLTASDAGAGVWRLQHGLDGGPLTTLYGPVATVNIGEGVHELRYSAEDYQDNASLMHTRTIQVDLTPPTVEITGIPDEIDAGDDLTVSYSCADALSDVFSCTAPIASGGQLDTSTPGRHTFTVVGLDRAGNETRETVEYRVIGADTTAPEVRVDLPTEPASGWHTSAVTLRFTATDTESDIAYIRWEYGTGSGTIVGSVNGPDGELELASTGEYTVLVWAEDAQGNRSEPHQLPVNIDLHAPVIEVNSPEASSGILPNGHYAQHERVLVEFDCADIGSGVDRCDGTTPDGVLLPTGTPGTHELRIVATDVAGNRTERTVSYIVDPAAASPANGDRDPRLAQTGAETVIPGIILVAVLLAAGAMLLTTRRLGGR